MSSLSESTSYTFSTYTTNSAGTRNATWVNATQVTSACGSAPSANFVANNLSACLDVPVVFEDTSINIGMALCNNTGGMG
jgi:PKD repeat protein